ncbi:MASE3 domain-containing protein [Undibacterium griseum]|uniref:Oxygen sensor histidine kinase NreB n=1 Tax=Undibacterium griseum TaxID=2762295 RepID=A0ABR6YM58_9BURK|nr:MASE3 domain-containing protein [Undibacterium griseum]MBC3884875.1 PAS domain S-box protein [Undibacterium griseum]
MPLPTHPASARLNNTRWLAFVLLLISGVIWLNQDWLSAFQIPEPLPVHTLLETVTIIIFASVFIVCWNAFGEIRKKSSVILAVAFLCTAILGFLHAITFQGMPGFSSPEDMHKSLSFWLVSRSIIATTLLGLALDPEDSPITQLQSYGVLLAGLLATCAWGILIFIFPDWIPLTFLPGKGQTVFKLGCELGLIAINTLTALLFYRHSLRFQSDKSAEHLHIERTPLFLASSMMAMSEVYFSIYAETSDVNVVIGHAFQLFSAIAIYRSMVAVNIHTPYAHLAATSATLEKSAEELKLERQRLSRMIDTAIDGIITVDEHQNIILANPAAALIFGYELDDLIGRSLNILIPGRHRHAHRNHVHQFGETGITRRKMGTHFEDFYVTGCRSSGEEFPIEASIAHQFENGHRFYTVIFRDITDRKVAKEKMAKYHEQLSQLSATLQSIREEERKHIARELHDDLGQLLAALRMDLSLLQRDAMFADKNKQTIHSMDQLILTAITTLRRIATDLRPRALDEGGLFFALQTLQKDFSQRHKIDCELIADETQLILDDVRSTAIYRIVQESLTNVARHAEASYVQIEFQRNNEQLRFTIADNGKGIDEQDMSKSQSFGLVGMRERIKAMNGEFCVSSPAGEGTVIEIQLPLHAEQSA